MKERRHARTLIHNFEAVFFDDRIRENLFRNTFELFLSFFTVPAIKVENEKLTLADIRNLRITQARKRVLNGLSLRIEHGTFRHYPDMSFHMRSV
jgi:hypothetical protein